MALTTISEKHEDNVEELYNKFLNLRADALRLGLTKEQLGQVLTPNQPASQDGMRQEGEATWLPKKVQSLSFVPVHLVHSAVVVSAIVAIAGVGSSLLLMKFASSRKCAIYSKTFFLDIATKPLFDCDICKDIHSVPEEIEISPQQFYDKYAYSGRPVLVKYAASHWTALAHFSYKFFQNLYDSSILKKFHCQFIPYQSDFLTLTDALNMSDDRAANKPGQIPWYFGWCNCHHQYGRTLRKYYDTPYFLPADSQQAPEDWIFIGGSGEGAVMHTDIVNKPSWQAQISGTKTWRLLPPTECEDVCPAFNVTVHKGDIFVFDSNIWGHSTFIHPGEISISIGSEYD